MRVRSSRTSNQRGQSVVFALLALLILSFAGALFISIVTRNIGTSGHSSQVESADFFARAGLKFADDELTTSLDGADWRPPTQVVATNDPDYDLINQGYTRYTYGDGRFLVKVVYDPVNAVTGTFGQNVSLLNRYIQVKSVGRAGIVDPTDPTTFTQGQQPLNDTLVGYKQIGLTDYARFITDPDDTDQVASIGVPSIVATQNLAGGSLTGLITPGVQDFTGNTSAPLEEFSVPTNLGAPDAYISSGGALTVNPYAGTGKPISQMTGVSGVLVAGGGSFRSNDSVRFYGDCNFYLDRGLDATVSNLPALSTEDVEIAGNVLEDNFNSSYATWNYPAVPVFSPQAVAPQSALVTANVATDISGNLTQDAIMPSNWNGTTASPFSTYGGAVRDGGKGANASDYIGQPRGINRLPPPSMNAVDTLSGLPRYKAITTTCGTWDLTTWKNTSVTPAQAGYGDYTYINNFSDVQSESSSPLPSQWVTESSPGWHDNDTYDPPGAKIVFGVIPGTTNYGYTITRSDVSQLGYVDTAGNPAATPVYFLNSDGTAGTSQALSVSYSNLGNSNNDIIIYAEGNVRLSGIVSPPTGAAYHVTVVTNATAYIDGSLLKGDPDSSIAVLAHDYVCVNTTQFLAGTSTLPLGTADAAVKLNVVGIGDDPNEKTVANAFTAVNAASATPPSVNLVDITATNSTGYDNVILQEFSFGLSTGQTPATTYSTGSVEYLYVSGQQDNLPSGFPANTATSATINLYTPAQDTIYPTALNLAAIFAGAAGTMTHTTLALTNSISGLTSDEFTTLDIDVPAGVGPGFQLERAAILPGDVRIEAILFAQTRSFFVIPGQWFNSNTVDNMYTFTKGTGTTGHPNPATGAAGDRFPFYGQPIDLKITIAGSVVEGHTADPGDQALWMEHWGWIPRYHGSLGTLTGETSGHNFGNPLPVPGLSIIYDPYAGYPYDKNATDPVINGTKYPPYLRYDSNGNPLPFAPKLPVCPGYIYEDEIPGQTPVS